MLHLKTNFIREIHFLFKYLRMFSVVPSEPIVHLYYNSDPVPKLNCLGHSVIACHISDLNNTHILIARVKLALSSDRHMPCREDTKILKLFKFHRVVAKLSNLCWLSKGIERKCNSKGIILKFIWLTEHSNW